MVAPALMAGLAAARAAGPQPSIASAAPCPGGVRRSQPPPWPARAQPCARAGLRRLPWPGAGAGRSGSRAGSAPAGRAGPRAAAAAAAVPPADSGPAGRLARLPVTIRSLREETSDVREATDLVCRAFADTVERRPRLLVERHLREQLRLSPHAACLVAELTEPRAASAGPESERGASGTGGAAGAAGAAGALGGGGGAAGGRPGAPTDGAGASSSSSASASASTSSSLSAEFVMRRAWRIPDGPSPAAVGGPAAVAAAAARPPAGSGALPPSPPLVGAVTLALSPQGYPAFRALPPEEGSVYLSNMAVAAGARRRGVGRALLAAAAELAAAVAPGAPLTLHVQAGDTAALALYAAAGFEEVAREPKLFFSLGGGAGGDGRRLVLMRKRAPSLYM